MFTAPAVFAGTSRPHVSLEGSACIDTECERGFQRLSHCADLRDLRALSLFVLTKSKQIPPFSDQKRASAYMHLSVFIFG